MKVFFNAVVMQLVFNLYIAYRGGQALPIKSLWRKGLYFILGAEVLLYLIGTLAFFALPEEPLVWIMTITSTWFIASIYVVMGLLLLELLRVIDRYSTKYYEGATAKRKAQIKRGSLVFIATAVFALITHGYYIVKNPVVEHKEIAIEKRLKSGEKQLRVAFFADLHISESIGATYVQNVVEKILAEQPDLVLIGGDLIDYHGKFAYRDGIAEMLKRLNTETKLGCYQVLGNHEYRADELEKRQWMRSISHLLIDSVVEIEPGLSLIGRDDPTNKDRAKLKALRARIPKENACILLEHQPIELEELEPNKIDFALYGHTHNGQIWPFTLMTRLAFEYAWGHYRKGNSQLYVSSGVGAAGPAIRVFTRSEILIFDLQFQ